ncbi:hypothetical protein B0H63DRAFT_182887 [Podospora didyma]|uniref:Uncharacterized protein n=1 Tax=Podospora didyma TaxID=330526 RepID=A0AAE0NPP5_9PEZI|nr:hypothetical protein B0H63DRAFT_182887 [Podospora didyma]
MRRCLLSGRRGTSLAVVCLSRVPPPVYAGACLQCRVPETVAMLHNFVCAASHRRREISSCDIGPKKRRSNTTETNRVSDQARCRRAWQLMTDENGRTDTLKLVAARLL